jgi:dihydroorotase
MTDLLLTNARLIDPENREEFMGSVAVTRGRITRIVPDKPENAGVTLSTGIVVDCKGKCLAPGIVDIGVKIGEPGERHKESFRTAGQAAAAGGVTTIVMRADTSPAIDTPETLAFVLNRVREETDIRVHPLAALTKARQGQEMTEIGFLLDAGALAFSDGDAVTTDPKIFARCLTYANALNALVIGHPQDPGLSRGAAVTSGKFATKQGLPGVSPMAERIGLERDLALVEMTSARYHADQITTRAALPALRRAKEAGLDVSAGVSIHHLTLNELDVAEYRSFFKVKPPLRAEQDRLAVVEAVSEGLIDIICSMHTPQDEESKRLPFEEAASGAVALETLLPAAMQLVHAGSLDLPTLFRAIALNPAKRLGLDAGRLAVGAPADLVLFDPDAPFVLDRFKLKSKSKNTPFDGRRMQGKVIATYVGGNLVYGEPG